MIKISQNINNDKKYNGVEKFIYSLLNNNKDNCPKNIKCIIYNYVNRNNKTSIFRKNNRYYIDINLKELSYLYKDKEYLNRGFNKKISFKGIDY